MSEVNLKPETYPGRAVAKKKKYTRLKSRKALQSILRAGDKLLGGDGYRVHLINGDFDFRNTEEVDLHWPLDGSMEFVEKGRKAPTICEFTPYAVAKASKIAMALNQANHRDDFLEQDFPIRIRADENGLHLAAFRRAVGSMEFTLSDGLVWKLKSSKRKHRYEFKAEEPIEIFVQAQFLYDATLSMNDMVLRMVSNRKGVYLANELAEYEAYIMPMDPEQCAKAFEKAGL